MSMSAILYDQASGVTEEGARLNVREDLATDRKGHGEDEQHKQCHLRHEEHEDLVEYV
jgi:hypothetical protein